MKTIPVSFSLPVELVRSLAGPSLYRAAKEAARQEAMADALAKVTREPTSAFVEAARKVALAFTDFENSQGTRDELRAQARLIASVKGLRKAVNTNKNL